MTTELKGILLCAALAIGEGLAFACDAFAPLWPLAAVSALAVALWGYGHGFRAGPLLSCVLCGMALAGGATERRVATLNEVLRDNAGQPLEATFVIGNDIRPETKRASGVTFTGEVRDIPVRVHLRLKPEDPRPRPGEVWRMTGRLGDTGDKPFGRRRPFWVGSRDTSATFLAASEGGGAALLRRVREDLSRRIGLGLEKSPRAADLNRAMLLGERFRLTDADRTAFVAAGTIHIFAISGLHVLFVAQLFVFFLRVLRVTLRALPLFLLPLIWLYVLLVGAAPSAVRAATMASFYHLAPLFWRKPNGFTAWTLAFLLSYGLKPTLWFDVGCALSFTVMFALILWAWWMKPFPKQRFGKLGFTAAAWLAGMPLAAHVFGRITPGGLLANLLIVPLAAVSVMMTALGLLFSFVWETLARHCNNLAALATDLMTGLSHLLARTGYSSYEVEPWSFGRCLVLYAAILFALLLARFLVLRARRTL